MPVSPSPGCTPGPREGAMFERILIGLDGSPGASAAGRWVRDLAARDDALVIAVHVVTPSEGFARDLSIDGFRSWRRERERQLRGPWVAPLRSAAIRCECRFVEAESTVDGLVAVANDEGVDLIVVGEEPRRHLAGRWHDRVSSSLGHRARQPVVVVPAAWARATVTS